MIDLVLLVLLVVVVILIVFYTTSYFFVLGMYRRIQPGDKVTLLLEVVGSLVQQYI